MGMVVDLGMGMVVDLGMVMVVDLGVAMGTGRGTGMVTRSAKLTAAEEAVKLCIHGGAAVDRVRVEENDGEE